MPKRSASGPPASAALVETALGHHLSPSRLGTRTLRETQPDVLVFPSYTRGARFDLRPLSKAQAASRTMGCLVNARGRGRHGFDDVARLMPDVAAYAMSYSDLDQAGHALASLLAPA